MGPEEFVSALRRRLHLPLPLHAAKCMCGTMQDALGDHSLSCNRAGNYQRRGRLFEHAWVRVFEEAGARVKRNCLVRDLALPGARDFRDTRVLDFVARGLPLHNGLPVCVDVTVTSPVTGRGFPKSRAALSSSGSTFKEAERVKRLTYHDVVRESDRCGFRILAVEIGGCFSKTCQDTVSRLVRHAARSFPESTRDTAAAALARRWANQLSVALQKAVVAGFCSTSQDPFMSYGSVPCLSDLCDGTRDVGPLVSRLPGCAPV